MLLPLQQTISALPQQVHVIVDRVPPTAGLPEWAKLLIAAGVGAVFGVGSNIAMEFIRPIIAKRLLIRGMKTQLTAELKHNISVLDAFVRVVDDMEKGATAAHAPDLVFLEVIADEIKRDRFEFYFSNNKADLYELEEVQSLLDFYETVKSPLPGISLGEKQDYSFIKVSGAVLIAVGQTFLKAHGITYDSRAGKRYNVYKRMLTHPQRPGL
jgi:hypothetical protein